jgi:crossover junction endodeoxyribonuclease RuvC
MSKRDKKIYIGVDPGQSGGMAILRSGTSGMVCPMPQTEKDVYDWFEPFQYRGSPTAIIEKVHSFPGQGVASTFKFGVGYGGLRMALIAAGIPFEEVTPRTWQKAFGIVVRKKTETKLHFKNRLKAHAQQIFPNVEGVTLKTCDALLMAEFCRRKELGLL